MPRVARVLLEGSATIAAVRFVHNPDPDYRDCRRPDLPSEWGRFWIGAAIGLELRPGREGVSAGTRSPTARLSDPLRSSTPSVSRRSSLCSTA